MYCGVERFIGSAAGEDTQYLSFAEVCLGSPTTLTAASNTRFQSEEDFCER